MSLIEMPRGLRLYCRRLVRDCDVEQIRWLDAVDVAATGYWFIDTRAIPAIWLDLLFLTLRTEMSAAG